MVGIQLRNQSAIGVLKELRSLFSGGDTDVNT